MFIEELPHYTLPILYHIKIFEHFALQVGSSNRVHKTRIHSIQRGCYFGAKTSRSTFLFWELASTSLNTGLSILDLDWLIFCTIWTCQLDEIHHLKTDIIVLTHLLLYKMEQNCLLQLPIIGIVSPSVLLEWFNIATQSYYS